MDTGFTKLGSIMLQLLYSKTKVFHRVVDDLSRFFEIGHSLNPIDWYAAIIPNLLKRSNSLFVQLFLALTIKKTGGTLGVERGKAKFNTF